MLICLWHTCQRKEVMAGRETSELSLKEKGAGPPGLTTPLTLNYSSFAIRPKFQPVD